MPKSDPYHVPAFPLKNRLMRFVWGVVYNLLFRPSPRPMFGWRNFLLGIFGARLERDTKIYPTVRIWAPWNLYCEDHVAIAEEAILYNPKLLTIRSHGIISQQAYICGATHDYEDPAFPLISFPTTLGAYSWVCARATVMPNVNLGDGTILALGSVAAKDLKPWTVYGGIPAKPIKARTICSKQEDTASV
jgi:putative colanic acid biosynthesis acetyltransferase WcaF